MTDTDDLRTRPRPAPYRPIPDETPSPASDGGTVLPLERLLALCPLSADQARVLAADLLRVLDRGAPDPGGTSDDTVRVGRDGRIHWAPGADGHAVARSALARLAVAGPSDAPPLAGLLEASRALVHPGVDPGRLGAEVDVDGEAGAVARRGLGALVGRATAAPTTARPRLAPPVTAPVRRRPVGWRGRTLWRRTWPWLLALAVLLLVVGGEVALLKGRIAGDLQALRTAGAPAASTTVAPAPAGRPAAPVPVVAPPAAGPVVGVDLRAVPPPCTPGASCPVRVLVSLGATGAVRPDVVAWHLEVVDRCSGTHNVLPTGRVPVPVGATEVYGLADPVLPPGRSLALLAVVDTPARAAAPGLLVGSTTC
ncbi:hypothetical protein LQ327_17700 [Actinomycetospora endophytica]|uniref:Uncharacterized protein n=1 Tax=Actinomycetospora endophytica TaxID=2291215 RepID=A0ABS8PAA1_9PSEU|nr:hypothetical protein [Actinomycetospora endophytica]MCD2195205.1 hypothetical protein [Actinomycetospora endophytica]